RVKAKRWKSLFWVMIFGIIFLTAVVVHIILHWVVLRTFEKRAIASSRLWLQIITQNKLFHRLAFTLQGIIVNIQAVRKIIPKIITIEV
ncbi:hypothetical protein ACUODJ_55315, partial [Escherichia sp. HC-CC]